MSGLRVAVVGSGPAGFYAAASLLAADLGVEVDMIDRLPTPWGLVRLGVAPDHPNIKAVSRAFEKIARRPGFRFLGNVEVGRDLSHDELAGLYDAVDLRVRRAGRPAARDPRRGAPGLVGGDRARRLVQRPPRLPGLDFDLSGERAVVIGNGNVALDVARMLALTEEELAPTDTTDAAIAAIVGSGIERDRRRRPARAGAGGVDAAGAGGARRARRRRRRRRSGRARARRGERRRSSTAADHIVKRNLDVLREFAAREPAGKPRRVVLRFRALARRRSSARSGSRASSSSANELEPDGRGSVRAVATDERETLAVRRRLPERRLSRAAARRRAVRRGDGDDAERRRPRARRGRRSAPRRLLRRLDQARPDAA